MVKKVLKHISTWLSRRKSFASPSMNYVVRLNNKLIEDTRIGSTTAIVGETGLNLGKNVFIGHHNFIESTNGITIEEGCQITNFISILTHSSHNSIRYYGEAYKTSGSDLKGYIKGNVSIGKYTFIGPHVTIMPNTIIGKGSIVSAFSLVKGKFPDFSIIAGNPAKIIGSTLEKDESFLKENPELRTLYNNWSK
jgi:acetyltransferase-like isoleucine patch superfamily enzyme